MQSTSSRLHHYSANDVNRLLRLLADRQPRPPVTSSGRPRGSRDTAEIPDSSDYDVGVPEDSKVPNIDVFRRAARGLHFVSIAILSVLLLEVTISILRDNVDNIQQFMH